MSNSLLIFPGRGERGAVCLNHFVYIVVVGLDHFSYVIVVVIPDFLSVFPRPLKGIAHNSMKYYICEDDCPVSSPPSLEIDPGPLRSFVM